MKTRYPLLLIVASISLAHTHTSMAQEAAPAPPPPPAADSIALRIQAELDREMPKIAEAQNRFRVVADRYNQLAQKNFNFNFEWPGSSSRSLPLIISKAQIDQDAASQDLQIMSRLLQKAVQGKGERESHPHAMGIPLFSQGSSKSPQALYIEGHGAIFLLQAPFPLSPPTSEPVTPAPKPSKPSAWEQTKRELYGPKESGHYVSRDSVVQGWEFDADTPVEYNADRVELLKKELIDSLKNSDNIRSLKSSDSITIVVTSYASSSPKRGKTLTPRSPVKTTGTDTDVDPPEPEHLRRPTQVRLVFKTTKSDVEARATGKLSDDQFRDRVQTWLN